MLKTIDNGRTLSFGFGRNLNVEAFKKMLLRGRSSRGSFCKNYSLYYYYLNYYSYSLYYYYDDVFLEVSGCFNGVLLLGAATSPYIIAECVKHAA